MAKASRKDMLLEAAVRAYAKNGMDGLKTKCLAEEAGCSEALIYRYFKSKEELLAECYMRLHNEVSSVFANFQAPEDATALQLLKIGMDNWMQLFKLFVDSGYESIFYFDFRMSPIFKDLMGSRDDVSKTYETSFMNIFESLRDKFKLNAGGEEFRAFLVNTTGMFAIKVIRGELPNTKETFKSIQTLIFGGIIASIPGMSPFDFDSND